MPAPSLTTSGLADKFGYTQATISRWVRQGILPSVPFHGPKTVHGDDSILRIEVIQRLGGTRRKGVAFFRSLFATTPRAELERLAGRAPPPPTPPSPKYRGRLQQAWHRVTLAPGVELHILNAADDDAQRVADEIITRYGR